MEHIIAKLLQDFEQGKMSRRQLLQTLALTAAAASAAGAAQTSAASGTKLQGVGISHISFDVADYRKTSAFYADLFGIELFQGTLKTQNHGRVGKSGTYVTFRGAGNRGRAADTPTGRVQHIAIAVEPWANHADSRITGAPAVEAELKRRGLPINQTGDPQVLDPEGFPLQLIGKTYETKN